MSLKSYANICICLNSQKRIGVRLIRFIIKTYAIENVILFLAGLTDLTVFKNYLLTIFLV